MKYMIHGEVPPERGEHLEQHPEAMQELMGAWQSHNPLAMHFSLARRGFFFLVEADNEDAIFEVLQKSWVLLGFYPTVDPVVDFEEFGQVLQRIRG